MIEHWYEYLPQRGTPKDVGMSSLALSSSFYLVLL